MTATLLGILNLSSDSFSDGGRCPTLATAIAHGKKLHHDGAWAVDIGAVSSNPDGMSIDADEEISRLRPVVRAFQAERIRVSLDTFSPSVQAHFAPSVEVLNDICGFPDPQIWPILARASCKLVVMHSVQRGRADRRVCSTAEVLDGLFEFFHTRLDALLSAGIDPSRLIVDPGMGFFLSAHPEPSVAALQHIQALKQHTGCEVLISVSRKSFLGSLLGGRNVTARGAATLAAELFAIQQGATWIRTHDVRSLHDAMTIMSILSGRESPVRG